MLKHLLPKSDKSFSVIFSSYAEKHYLNEFRKKYKGKIWNFTEDSIIEDLSRLRIKNNTTQESSQIDEFNYDNGEWLVKYDFKIAGTNKSPKSSGNRCVLYINNEKDIIKVLLIYAKTNLPKNKNETKFIMDELKNNYGNEIKKLLINK